MHFHHHGPGAVLLSLLIAVAGCYIALGLVARGQHGSAQASRFRLPWVLAGGFLFGASIWSMHFTAMLALELPFPVSYDWSLTALSLLMAGIFASGGLYLASSAARPLQLPLAGLVTGIGIAGMHYTGMAAMRMPAQPHFESWSVLVGSGIAVVAATLAFRVALRGREFVRSRRSHLGAAVLGGLAVALFHYLAMAGTSFSVEHNADVAPGDLSALLLLAVVVLATVIALGLGLLATLVDRSSARQSDLQETLTQLHLRQQLLRRSSGLAEIELDADGCILHVTDAAWALLGNAEAPGGKRFRDFVEPADQDRCDALLRRALYGSVGETSDPLGLRLRQQPQPVPVVAAVLGSGPGRRLLLVCETASDARRDPDTGLPNRQSVLAWRGEGEPVLAVRCSIASFDELAQMLDPVLFRQLLQAQTEVLQAALTDTRVVQLARLSTVDFLLLLVTRDAAHTEAVLARLVRLAALPLWVGGNPWHLPMRLGAAELEAGVGGELALRCTAAALHRAEREQVAMRRYQPAFDREWQEQMQLEQELHAALAEHQFRLLFQPKLELASGRVCGAEALLRWQHPQHGVVTPQRFIPALESTGLIEAVGEWVIDQSLLHWCRMVEASQPVAGGSRGDFVIAINVSPLQLRYERFVAFLDERRRAYNVPAAAIELEITEGVAMDRSPQNLAILHTLRQRGYRLAIDDFGTGYSSLAYLRDLPIDTLKIDREFVRRIDDDALAARMLGHMVEIGHTLGHQVVAEGVETEKQLAAVRQLQVDQVQGYLIGRPMPVSDLIALLRAEREAVTPVVTT